LVANHNGGRIKCGVFLVQSTKEKEKKKGKTMPFENTVGRLGGSFKWTWSRKRGR